MRAKIAESPKEPDLHPDSSKTEGFVPGRLLAQWISIFVGGGILFTLYLLISRIIYYDADDASILLEAQAMLHGNYIMSGWYMPTDSFLTIDMPLYALGLQLGFSLTALLHIIPSLLYTLLLLCSGYLVSTLLPHKQRFWGWLALLGILAFPSPYLVQLLLVGPIHVGTFLFALVGLIAYKHFLSGARGKWLAFAILQLLMILAIVGDPLAQVFLVLPLLLTECTQMLVKKRISLQGNAVFFGTLLAFGIARVILWLLAMASVHILNNVKFSFTTIHGMATNLRQAVIFVYTIFRANIFTLGSFSFSNVPIFINAFVVSIFGLTVAFAVIYAVMDILINRDKHTLFQAGTIPETKIRHVSIWSTIGTLAAFILSTLGGVLGRRYLYPLLFLSELATFPVIFKFVNKHILRIVVVLVFVANAIPFAILLAQAPASRPPEIPLLAVLKEHHLTHGLGSYWSSASVTVLSEEQVVIRQIVPHGNYLYPDYFLADRKWFDPVNLQQANFIIYRKNDGMPVYYNAAVHTFGKPDHQYDVNGFTILAWDSPLLTHLQPGVSFK